MRPLADKIRPKSLDEVVGQKHLVGSNGVLRRLIESKNIPNMIFYGPSGTGKTTIANIIASLILLLKLSVTLILFCLSSKNIISTTPSWYYQ